MTGISLLGTTHKPLLMAVVLVIAMMLTGCGSDDDVNGVQTQSADDLVDLGWDRFEDADYITAVRYFKDATAQDSDNSDAWNGAGWSSGRIPGQLDQAIVYFNTAYYEVDTTRYDALAGLAFGKYQAGEWQDAIDKADYLLFRRVGWRFLHEPTLDHNDVWLLIAKSYYNLNEYQNCYETIRERLNDTFEANIGTEQGLAELLQEIERLGQIYG